MASNELREVRPGERPTAAQQNLLVQEALRKRTGPGMLIDSTGVYERPVAAAAAKSAVILPVRLTGRSSGIQPFGQGVGVFFWTEVEFQAETSKLTRGWIDKVESPRTNLTDGNALEINGLNLVHLNDVVLLRSDLKAPAIPGDGHTSNWWFAAPRPWIFARLGSPVIQTDGTRAYHWQEVIRTAIGWTNGFLNTPSGDQLSGLAKAVNTYDQKFAGQATVPNFSGAIVQLYEHRFIDDATGQFTQRVSFEKRSEVP